MFKVCLIKFKNISRQFWDKFGCSPDANRISIMKVRHHRDPVAIPTLLKFLYGLYMIGFGDGLHKEELTNEQG